MAAVTLEPVALHHAPLIQPLAEDPAIGATTNLPEPYPPDGAEAFVRAALEKRASGEEHIFVVLADGRLVGICGLLGIGGEAAGAELGYWIGRPYWGHGYATAAARLAVAFAFRELGAERLRAMCLDTNAASWRVLEKVGFRFTGYGRNLHPKWPETARFAQFEMPRSAWRET